MAGMRQRLLDSLAPLVMSDLHFSVAATSSLSPDFSSKITTQTLVFFSKIKKKNMLRRISSQTFTFLKVSGSLIYAV